MSEWGSAEKQDVIYTSSLCCPFWECILHFKECSLIQGCVCPALKLQESNRQGCLRHLPIPKCFIESLAHICAQIHMDFINACFCCIPATIVTTDTPGQGSTNVFSGRPGSKYFSLLGALWSVLQVLNSATGWGNELQTILNTEGARLCANKA